MMGNVTIQKEKQCENESLNYDKISLKLHGEQEVLKKKILFPYFLTKRIRLT
jgi:hypothetical protein